MSFLAPVDGYFYVVQTQAQTYKKTLDLNLTSGFIVLVPFINL